MAETKKAATVKTVEKTEITARPVAAVAVTEKTAKVPEKKEEVKAEKKAEIKAEIKAPAKKSPVKKTPAKKAPVKKTEAKPAAKAPANKAAKLIMNLQFAGKSYTMEDLVKIAEDVWKYDLHKSNEEYKSLELYVKPEESVAYYVFNGDVSGNFFI